jgi:hypothetical protein
MNMKQQGSNRLPLGVHNRSSSSSVNQKSKDGMEGAHPGAGHSAEIKAICSDRCLDDGYDVAAFISAQVWPKECE